MGVHCGKVDLAVQRVFTGGQTTATSPPFLSALRRNSLLNFSNASFSGKSTMDRKGPASEPRWIMCSTSLTLRDHREHFEDLMQTGVVCPSNSKWSSPLHLVPKQQSGQWRPCGDYRNLNRCTKPDRYPLPNIVELNNELRGKTIFPKIDLARAYFQIPVRHQNIPKTAVTTPFVLYEFVMMPSGLRNAAQTFQRFIDQALRGITNCFAYVDDILLANASI
uniref:Reverse transcriptase domain-containing protein n=1 Tax=Trichuris muris TaxID=70415 RepID=A0A5S6QQL5_TRIMR